MTLQYLRRMTLTVGGQVLVQLQDDASACLRVRFQVAQQTIQTPNKAIITIFNLSDGHANSLVAAKPYQQKVTLSAGYNGNEGMIFSGELLQAAKRRESPTDTVLVLTCADSMAAYRHGVISKSLAKGSTPLDHANAFIQAWAPFGITKGYLPTQQLSQLHYPRGVAFAGMITDYMRTLAHSNECSWSIQNGAVQMVPQNGYIPGGAVVVNSSTGMIGMPEQTGNGVEFQVLINSAILIDRLVQIDQKDINQASVNVGVGGTIDPTQVLPALAADGQYRVYEILTVGDTRGRDWYMACTGLPIAPGSVPGTSGVIPQAAINSGLYPSGLAPDSTFPNYGGGG